MELLRKPGNKLMCVGVYAGLAAVGMALGGCSQDNAISPTTPIGRQIESAYPSATDIWSHYNNDGKTNTKTTWTTEDGRHCSAQSSKVGWDTDIPTSLVGPVSCTAPSPSLG